MIEYLPDMPMALGSIHIHTHTQAHMDTERREEMIKSEEKKKAKFGSIHFDMILRLPLNV